MSKAEKFIRDCTRNCSNEIQSPYPQIVENIRKIGGELAKEYHPWLTPDQARMAVEIAREEMIERACDAYCAICDTKECDGCAECTWVIKFRRQLLKY